MQKLLVFLIFVAALVFVAGCVEDTPPEQVSTPVPAPTVKPTSMPQTPVPAATTVTVKPTLTVSEITVMIMDNTFSPSALTIKTGSQVRWVNGDDHNHRVNFVDGGFTAFLLAPSQSSSQQFYRQGVYDYSCMIYPTMHGRVTVVD
jgi:plastocyanin